MFNLRKGEDLLVCSNWNGSFECVCTSGYLYNYTSQKCEGLFFSKFLNKTLKTIDKLSKAY